MKSVNELKGSSEFVVPFLSGTISIAEIELMFVQNIADESDKMFAEPYDLLKKLPGKHIEMHWEFCYFAHYTIFSDVFL